MFYPLILTNILVSPERFIFRILGLLQPPVWPSGSPSVPGSVPVLEGPHAKVCAQCSHTSELYPHSRSTGLGVCPPGAPLFSQGMGPKEDALEMGLELFGRGFWQSGAWYGREEIWALERHIPLALSDPYSGGGECTLKHASTGEEVPLAWSKGTDSEVT